ncbi:MAG: hypothetical protein LBV80_10875 [Deltaproteobacteria bacterium]|jgi:hypothetical protein|nr:hypothetical protein [Deltaproteobacteria bacterium]
MPISRKLTLLVTFTVILLVSLLGITAYFLFSSSSDQQAREQLISNTKAAQEIVQSSIQTQETLSAMIMRDEELARALAEGDMDTLKAIARSLVGKRSIEMITIIDASSKVLVRGHTDQAGDVLPPSRISSAVPLRDGRVVVGLEPGNAVKMTLASGSPIRYNGQIVARLFWARL